MALIARFLVDTSAAARMRNPEVAHRVGPLIEAGLVATTAALDSEALYSARDPADYERLWSERRMAYEYLPIEDEHWRAALSAQRSLVRDGRHRVVGMPDLLTAVLAAEHRLVVIHYDADFDTAATVIDFDHAWVLPRGSV